MSGLMLCFRKNRGVGDQIVIRDESGEETVITYLGVDGSNIRLTIESKKTSVIFRRSKDGSTNEKP